MRYFHVQLSNSAPPPPPPPHPTPTPSTVKFEDCQRGREMGFVTNDPSFSVGPDGTVYTEQDVSNLSEPVQFMVTAKGPHDPRVWETTVKLALAGHPHPLALSKVTASNQSVYSVHVVPRVHLSVWSREINMFEQEVPNVFMPRTPNSIRFENQQKIL